MDRRRFCMLLGLLSRGARCQACRAGSPAGFLKAETTLGPAGWTTCATDPTPDKEIYDLFGSLASALAANNAIDFMARFDPAMQGYAKLQADVSALVSQNDIAASIDIDSNEGDDRNRTVEVDWLLQIKNQANGPLVRRDEKVTCGVQLQKKQWKIVSLKPLSFFAPPASGP